MKLRTYFFSVAITILGIFCTNAAAQAPKSKTNAKLAKQATVSLETARQTALETASGAIESEELEKEHGKLVYSFDIRNSKGTISEVQIDARTGAVVSNVEETKADEEREKREDDKHARSKKVKTRN